MARWHCTGMHRLATVFQDFGDADSGKASDSGTVEGRTDSGISSIAPAFGAILEGDRLGVLLTKMACRRFYHRGVMHLCADIDQNPGAS